jgi:RNA polymerase sigma-70 factor (ECF subfamily)
MRRVTENEEKSFAEQLAESQNRLYGYIFSLVNNHHQAADVLQETNLALWRKAAEYNPERAFLPWAFTFARFQVMASQRDRRRDKTLLDPDVLELVAVELEEDAGDLEAMQVALRSCMAKLPTKSRSMIDARYFVGLSIKEMAEEMAASISAVKVGLLRIRKKLRYCVQGEMERA